ncbi:hypothetical protein [Brucella intermedia]|uniref:hypothetical protein n=1 Tax=Brucella intermedia TaxID=94625 RepID=UPI0023610A3C|nr:hypothetical protein [Brucella intermedia]
MKSWGERLIARMKNWGSRKTDAAPDQPSDVERAEKPGQPPTEKSSIKVTTNDSGYEASDPNWQVFSANTDADVQMTGADLPKVRDSETAEPEPPTGEANNARTRTSSPKLSPEQRGARSKKFGGHQPTSVKGLAALDEVTVNAAAGKQRLTSNSTNLAHQERPKPANSKVRMQRFAGTGGKSAHPLGPKSPSQGSTAAKKTELSQEPFIRDKHSLPLDGANGNASASIAPASRRKSPRFRKPKIRDEQVTDEQLAELEAENIRLKLLLREKLSAKQINSEN